MKKFTRAESYAEPYATEQAETFPSVGGMVITKVVREHVNLVRPRDGYGESFGQMIDQHLAGCLERGEEVQSFTLEINQDYWMEQLRNR